MKFNRAIVFASLVFAACGLPSSAAAGPGQGSANAAQGGAVAVKASDLSIPVDEIIRRFAQHESQFKRERENYTYSQSVTIQDAGPEGPFDGLYRMDSDIIFTPQGKRIEQVTYAPQSTLQHLTLTQEDMSDLENVQPFVLTTEDLPKYDVTYKGREKVDELGTYVFQVAPKKIEKGQRYFQGTVWVDDHDFAVVKSDGKAVPEIGNQRFPRFQTYRENIEADYWFPTYTHIDDVLHFPRGKNSTVTDDVRIRMTMRYSNYKRYGATVKIGESKKIEENTPSSPEPTK
jgi:hypothetical protein